MFAEPSLPILPVLASPADIARSWQGYHASMCRWLDTYHGMARSPDLLARIERQRRHHARAARDWNRTARMSDGIPSLPRSRFTTV